MPCKNEIDWNTRKEWLTVEIDSRLRNKDLKFETTHQCVLDINDCYGLLSVSQIYRALKPYPINIVIAIENQIQLF